ncbi:MAG: ATP-binding protein [Actinomycetota bacterium]|nr:ATP-binding protein [Actinomycetota bacterium]
MRKPADLYDRDREWAALDPFVSTDKPGSTLGLIYGRRRQGKTYLLESLTEATGGFYFAALRQSSTQNLDRLADAYRVRINSRARVSFQNWEEALEALLALGENADAPVVVALDEFPYLLEVAPELPSILQALLSPRGSAATRWRTRLLVCGSALSTMRGLLAGTAPLRGRSSLDLTVHPFGYRDAAGYWNVAHDPELAMQLHALVGGTPAYLDMSGGEPPHDLDSFDQWVSTTLLNPASAMFREGNALLSEEERITDTTPYLAVLAAISGGATRRGEIAAAVGRPADSLAHPLTVLAEARLIRAVDDALKQKRTTYHVAEPIVSLNELIIRPNEARLARHQAVAVWKQTGDTVSAKIYGPHFEELARTWCAEHAAPATLGGQPDIVAATQVPCREHGHTHEIDVVVIDKSPNQPNRIVAIGEAKWQTQPFGPAQLTRLEHLRNLLNADDARILLFSRTGFTGELKTATQNRGDLELVDVARLYSGA